MKHNKEDGDAGRLIEQIASARADLYNGKPPPGPEEVPGETHPYPVPLGWSWVPLAQLGVFLGGGTPSKSNPAFWKGDIPWVSPKDMKRPYIGDAADHISNEAVQKSSVKLVASGSLLMVVRGMILAHSFPVAITTREVTINQDMKALVLAVPDIGEYLLRACQAARPRMLAQVARSSHGTCRLDGDAVTGFPIPLPPLAEQKRIVAQVDQLMALCDDLEAKLQQSQQHGERLMQAVVEGLVA